MMAFVVAVNKASGSFSEWFVENSSLRESEEHRVLHFQALQEVFKADCLSRVDEGRMVSRVYFFLPSFISAFLSPPRIFIYSNFEIF